MSRPTRHRYGGSRRAVAVAGGALALVTLLGATEVLASVIVGSPGDDVSEGQDRDNAANALVQPPGVGVPQHLSNTDVVFGRLGDDFIAGRAGDDVVVGGEGDDVLVGGPDERGWPGSDVLLGDEGDDVAVWGTGDRSESFVGDVGRDTQVVGRLLLTAGGDMRTTRAAGRVLPRASLLAGPQRCEADPGARRRGGGRAVPAPGVHRPADDRHAADARRGAGGVQQPDPAHRAGRRPHRPVPGVRAGAAERAGRRRPGHRRALTGRPVPHAQEPQADGLGLPCGAGDRDRTGTISLED